MTQVFSNPIILAIDTNSENEAFDLVNELKENIGAVKLGLEYFHSYGPEGVRKIKNLNIPIFLDLKLHDIPITVKKSIETLIDLEPTILNVHALGGEEMMKVAAQVILDNNCSTKLLAVTILTSMDNSDLNDIGITDGVNEGVKRLALLAKKSGLNGVVCSSKEISIIRESCGDNFTIIVPGIRPIGVDRDDQKRVMTPREALGLGANFLVIGRPITQAKNPLEAIKEIILSIS
jgi:orotidine-5'-phosphate decarboxylase|tara:strand:- start:1095 stop:1796 length:702 start_codon:yes stop_codon:yes gene_type:complete